MAATEEQIVTAPAEENPGAEEAAGAVGKPKKAKGTNANKTVTVAKKAKKTLNHPPYFEMMSEAITTLKERNGSSQYAIQKFIEEKHKALPPTFRKLLLVNLRKFVASGRLVKVKGSFKLPSKRPAASKPEHAAAPVKSNSAAAATKTKIKAVAAVKPKTVAAKPKPKAKTMAATKPIAKSKAKSKPVAKAKAVVAAPSVKAKTAGPKRKAVTTVKPKPAKVAKTSAKSTPSKKAAPVAARKASVKKAAPAVVKKAAAVKSVKPKSVKSPAKRAISKRGKK